MSLSPDKRAELEAAVATYQGSVLEARDYLEGRGITGAIAGAARLGVVTKPLMGHEHVVGRLAIPFLTLSGPVDIRFRCIENHGTDEQGAERKCKDAGHGKYLSLPGHEPRLYNALSLATDRDTVAVCEGEMDTLIVQHHLGIPAVGLPGAQTWTKNKHYPRLLRPFRRVLVFADADEAGRDLGRQIARDVEQAVVVQLNEGFDVTDTFLLEGAEGLAERAGL